MMLSYEWALCENDQNIIQGPGKVFNELANSTPRASLVEMSKHTKVTEIEEGEPISPWEKRDSPPQEEGSGAIDLDQI